MFIVSYFKKIKNTRGFTLIELLVVIAIIGILSSVVLASLNTAREDARNSQRQQDMSQIRTAMELCANTEGDYSSCTPGISDAGALEPYIQGWPLDPSTDSPYNVDNNASDYCIWTAEWEGTDIPNNDAGCNTSADYSIGTGTI